MYHVRLTYFGRKSVCMEERTPLLNDKKMADEGLGERDQGNEREGRGGGCECDDEEVVIIVDGDGKGDGEEKSSHSRFQAISPSPSSQRTVNSARFYDQYHGHSSRYLSSLLSSLRQDPQPRDDGEGDDDIVDEADGNEKKGEGGGDRKVERERSCIFLAGDSSLDNKHWVYRPMYEHTEKAFYDDENVGENSFSFPPSHSLTY